MGYYINKTEHAVHSYAASRDWIYGNAEQFYECSAMLGILSIAKDYDHAENAGYGLEILNNENFEQYPWSLRNVLWYSISYVY